MVDVDAVAGISQNLDAGISVRSHGPFITVIKNSIYF
jgi:hypothetical protein